MQTVASMIVVIAHALAACSSPAPATPQEAEARLTACAAPPDEGPLAIEHWWPEDEGGTIHAPDRTRVSLDGSSVTFTTDLERGVLAPHVAHRVELGGGRHLLLGSSSWGGGNVTLHAIVLRSGPSGLRVADTLELTQRRAGALLLLAREGGALRIGVVEPSDPSAAAEWELRLGATPIDASHAAALSFAALGATRARVECFAPGWGTLDAPAATTRVAWIALVGERFREGGGVLRRLPECRRPMPPLLHEDGGQAVCVRHVLFTRRESDGAITVTLIGEGFRARASRGPRVTVGAETPLFQYLGDTVLSASLSGPPPEGAPVLLSGSDTGFVFRAADAIDDGTTR